MILRGDATGIEGLQSFGNVSDDFLCEIAECWQQMDNVFSHGLISRGMTVNGAATLRDYDFQKAIRKYDGIPYEAKVKSFYSEETQSAVIIEKTRSLLFSKVNHIEYRLRQTLALAIYNIFEVGKNPGFMFAFTSDKSEFFKNDDQNSAMKYVFSEMWSYLSVGRDNDFFGDLEISEYRNSYDWIKANMPLATTGFRLPPETINKVDKAGNAPLHNLGLHILPDELRVILTRGADPYLPNSAGVTADEIFAQQPEAGQFGKLILQTNKFRAELFSAVNHTV